MADNRPRGRGRGRGRASLPEGAASQPPQQHRGPAPQTQHQPPAGAWGARPPQQAPQHVPQQPGPPPQGAWGQRPAQQQQPGPRAPMPQPGPRAPLPQAVTGRGLHRTEAASTAGPTKRMAELDIGAGGDARAVVTTGRGNSRGRRNVEMDYIRTRPASLTTKCGTSGQSIKVKSNYFRIDSIPEWCLHNYRVDFAPEEDRTNIRQALLRVHKEIFGGGYLFDGTVLYTPRRLQPDPMELFSKRDSDEEKIRITIRRVGELSYGDVQYIQVFNLIMRKCLGHLKLQLVQKEYYDANAKIDIREHRMELWPGYKTSIRQHEQHILMCAEVTHKVMRRDTVLDLLEECSRESRDPQKLFEQRVIGVTVLTDYNNRTYKISDVDWKTTPESTFDLRNGEKVSFKSYYQTKYGLTIRNVNQPMLISRAKVREIRSGAPELLSLVPELCRMTGLTDMQRSNFNLMRALAEHTRMAPDGRVRRLQQFCDRLKRQPEAMTELKQWDLKLSNQLVDCPARVLGDEQIVQGNNIRYKPERQVDWTGDLRSNPMLTCANLTQWACVCPNALRSDAQNFVKMLIKAASGMSFHVSMPRLEEIRDDRIGTYLEALENAISNKPQLILCIVSNNKVDRYSAIKKKCCADRAVPTQVVVGKTLKNKTLMSIATKVAIQLNCKLGGAPWGVEIPLSGLMTIGYDVSRDTLVKANSYGAMVASIDKNCTRYYSSVAPHTSGEELSNNFAHYIAGAVRKYLDVNKTLPLQIIIYRDGVGFGDVAHVNSIEIECIKSTLMKAYNREFKMAFIIVSKRINTRFFMGDMKNPPPGTVVDDVVTLPERYDFFLTSQKVRQGTVTPTSYNVIYDTSGLDPDKIQRLTYKMCHLYYNWSGTVRVPAPCQYAHKLAFLVTQALHKAPNPALCDSLHFL